MKSVILGLGNSILREDAVGLYVARVAGDLLEPGEPIDIIENERGGMDVVDAIAPYDRAIIVDAIKTGSHPPGTILDLAPDHFPSTRRLAGLHDLDLPTALAVARRLGQPVPEHIAVIAIEIADDTTFGEEMSDPVSAAVSKAAVRSVTLARGQAHGAG